MQVKDFMKRNILFVHPDDSVRNAANIMAKYDIGSILVLTEKRDVIGIVADSDITRAVGTGKNLDKLLVKNMMSRNVVFIKDDALLEDAANAMIENKIKKLPIKDEGGNLIGIITASDIMLADYKFVKVFKTMMEAKNKEELDFKHQVSKFEYDF